MTSTARHLVAEGNGLHYGIDELPRFQHHAHPETESEIHRSWDDCADSMCTWAGGYDTDSYTKGSAAWNRAKAAETEFKSWVASVEARFA